MQISDVLLQLQSSTEGLHEDETRKRLDTYGRNEIGKVKGPSGSRIFTEQFRNLLVTVLLGVTLLSFLMRNKRRGQDTR